MGDSKVSYIYFIHCKHRKWTNFLKNDRYNIYVANRFWRDERSYYYFLKGYRRRRRRHPTQFLKRRLHLSIFPRGNEI